MKNHEGMFKALLAGETLVLSSTKSLDAPDKLTIYMTESGVLSKSLGLYCMQDIFQNPSLFEIVPKTIDINGFEVPAPLRTAPRIGETYWTFELYRGVTSIISYYTWDNDPGDKRIFKLGLVHSTREAAELHAEALLSFTKREPNE